MNEPVHNSQLTTHNFPLVLASSSPRRAEILTSLGIPFTVDPADVAEDVRAGESAGDAASRLATALAMATAAVISPEYALGDIFFRWDGRWYLATAGTGYPHARPGPVAEIVRRLS